MTQKGAPKLIHVRLMNASTPGTLTFPIPSLVRVLLPAVGKSKGNQRRLHQPTMKRTPKEKCLENHMGPLYVNSLSEMSASLQRKKLVPTYLNSFMSFCAVRKLIFCSLLTPSGQWNSVIKLYFLVSQ